MKIDILTLFPQMFDCLNESIIGRAIKENKVQINIVDIRTFSKDKHKKCDDYPFGGGAGMVLMVEPVFDAIMSVKQNNSLVILTSPRGETLNQKMVKDLAKIEHLIIVCGHYEGIDERIIELCIDKQVSLGDFVLTGGEIPALAIVDSVCRYVPEVLSGGSLQEESFSDNLLEYPQYTRPQKFMDLSVPEILLSGHHEKIEMWRQDQAQKITKKSRPDLLKK
ncbi:MAG: tRNA (guanosine(37)-N1)-methyltransferase TrmD [Clostridia bacterium]|nr:tRNA (guanosine(37)-N1)-methyltransferase TrmD [Clostridia bacterium]